MIRNLGAVTRAAVLAAIIWAAPHAAAQDAAQSAPAPEPLAAPEAPPRLIPTSDFAGRSSFWNAQLSPDGLMLSFLRRRNGEAQFIISQIGTNKVVRAFGTDPADQIEWYRWVTNDKLLISVSTAGEFFGDEVRYTRLILVQISDGSMTRLFGRSNVVEGDNVIHVAEDGSHILVAIQKSVYDYPAVIRHELTPGGKTASVQEPRDGVWNWIADNQGVVRMGTGWQNGRLKVYYRPDAKSDLKLVARLKERIQPRLCSVRGRKRKGRAATVRFLDPRSGGDRVRASRMGHRQRHLASGQTVRGLLHRRS